MPSIILLYPFLDANLRSEIHKFDTYNSKSSEPNSILLVWGGFPPPPTIIWTPAQCHSIISPRLRTQSCKTDSPHPSPLQTPVLSPDYYLCFWPTSYRSDVPMTLTLGLITLLERLMELRETFYSLYNQFIIKEYNPGKPDERDT